MFVGNLKKVEVKYVRRKETRDLAKCSLNNPKNALHFTNTLQFITSFSKKLCLFSKWARLKLKWKKVKNKI